MPTDTNVNKLIINYLTLQQYQSITPNEGELYFVDNEVDALPGQGAGDSGKALTANGDGTCKWSEFPSLDQPHEWTAGQTFPGVATDSVSSSSTGNYMLQMTQDGETYRVHVGTTSRPMTLHGSEARPHYASTGEADSAHAFAFVDDIPAEKHAHTVAITYAYGERSIALSLHGESESAEPITDQASLAAAFPNAKLPASGAMYESGVAKGTVLYVDAGAGEIAYWYEPSRAIARILLSNMPGAEIKEAE